MKRSKAYGIFFCSIFLASSGVKADVKRIQPRVVMGISAPIESLDVFNTMNLEAYRLTKLIVEPLAKLNPRSKNLEPLLAKSWVWSADHLRLEVSLRQNVKFHNGETLSAEDVKFSFDSFHNPRFKAKVWTAMWPEVSSVKVVSPLTVQFYFSKPSYQSFENLMSSMRISSRKFLNNKATNLRKQLMGTGPFKLFRYNSSTHLEMSPHLQWWGNQVNQSPDFLLVVKTVADPLMAEQLFQRKEIDFYELHGLPRGLSVKTQELLAYRGQGFWLHFNLRNPLFQDFNVRQSLLLLWDRKRTNKMLFDESFAVAVDTFSPQLESYPPGSPLEFDMIRAKQLLEKAGYKDEDHDSVLEKNAKPFAFKVLVSNAEDERWVSLFQADAAKLGIQVSINRVFNEQQAWKLINESKFDVLAASGGLDDGVYPGSHSKQGQYNSGGFFDLEVEGWLKEIENTFAIEERGKLQRKMIAKVRSLCVNLPGLYQPKTHFFVSKRLKVAPDDPFQIQLWRLEDQQN